MKGSVKLSGAEFGYAASMAVACFVSYEVATHMLAKFVESDDQFLGGMWATVATVFVFKDVQRDSFSAGYARLIATGVSFVLCLAYLCVFPFTPVGLAVLLGLGTVVMLALNRPGDIGTTGITTAVVMVVAAMGPRTALHQPLLRVVDTVVGIAIGVFFDWVRLSLVGRLHRQEQASP